MLRIGNTVGAAMTGRRVLEPVEARLMISFGLLLLALAVVLALFPPILVYPALVITTWLAIVLLFRGLRLLRLRRGRGATR
jgi:cardiolipin synthase